MKRSLLRVVGALELLGLSAAFATVLARGEREIEPRPAQSGPALTGVIITGYVLDAATGKPVRDAQVSTVPPTETVVTNGQGLYVLSLGASFGTVTVVADARRYRQVRSTCVSVKAGLNTLGDVVLLHEDEDVDDTCPTECAAGEQCRLGHCVPGCAPACECTDTCEAGECVPNENVPGADSCGNNATWLGGGLCACKPGYVVSTYGRNCVSATQATNCPENAFATESGCACSQGFVPNREGDQCVTPAEAAVPAPLGDGAIVSQWELPMKMPRGLAVAGSEIWTVNLDTESLTKLALGDDGKATIAAEVPLGGDAWRIKDLAATADQVFLVRRGIGESRPGSVAYLHPSTLMLLETQTMTLKHVAGNNTGDIGGIAVTDDALLTLEYDQIHQRSLTDGTESGVPLRRQDVAAVNPLLLISPSANTNSLLGLSFTRSQLVGFQGTTYDGTSFVGRFEVLNGAATGTAPKLRDLSVTIPGSHVAGFDFSGATGWIAVGGSGLTQPVLGKVTFDGAI